MQPKPDQGTVSLVIKSFLKPNDAVTLGFSRQQKAYRASTWTVTSTTLAMP